MQRVIHLIEALRGAGIEAPPYPYVMPPSAGPEGQPVCTPAELQRNVDVFEARVQAWRQDVVALHALHFPDRPSDLKTFD